MAELKLFQLKNYADDKDWKVDLQTKVSAISALEKAGAEGRPKLQLYLAEVVWAVLRSELTVSRAVDLLSKTRIPSRENLQRLFADVLWLVGFAAIEQCSKSEMREEFNSLCAQIEKEAVLPRQFLALSLETESVPTAVCQTATLKKKINQAKTKARYTITRYNLLREHTEGYAKLFYLLDRLASLEWCPEATQEQAEQTQSALIDDAVRLAGFGYLCPNRIVSMALDIYEQFLEEGNEALAQPLIALMRRFPQKRLTEVAVFQLLSHVPPPSAGSRDSRTPPASAVPPTNPAQFLAIATLIAMDLVDVEVLWSYLDPTDASIKQTFGDLMSKYEEDVAKLSKVDLGSSSTSDHRNAFARAFQTLNQSGHQKFKLAAALVSVNAWKHAHRVLLHLHKLGKPSLNHYIRTALCDLLKWMISPVLRQDRKFPRHRPPLDTSFAGTRRFSSSLRIESSGALQQVTEFEQLIPSIRHILEHLEYFLHTDIHLLSSLLRTLAAYLQHRKKAGGTVPDGWSDPINSILWRHILPSVSLVPHNPHLSDLVWSVMSQLSVFQRYLIYSCWETMYDNFLLKFACDRTKHATKQILKRVVSNAERKDLIAHQSHFHFGKLCHANPIPALETMLKDVEIGFNVNMIQPYVECTNRCSEMTADVMGFMFTRSCSKPVSRDRPFLNQADATLSSWLVNLGEFVGRFFKKHPHTDLHGLLTQITKRINSEVVERGPGITPAIPQTEYKGESLIRVILENLIEYMGGYFTVVDMNEEQLVCLAGGPRLRGESISFGKKEESGRKERAKQMLFNAITDLGLVKVLWYSLSQQLNHFLSEEFSEMHSGGGLKLLGLLFDGINECFLKLTEFLVQSSSRDKYVTLLPSFQEVFSMFPPSLAFLAIRHGLPLYSKAGVPAASTEASEVQAVTNGTGSTNDADGAALPRGSVGLALATQSSPDNLEPDPSVVELEKVVRLYLPAKYDDIGVSMQFYLTFWRLSLQDICLPSEGYERALNQISQSLKQMEAQKKTMERERSHAHDKELKSLRKESTRVLDLQSKLKEEFLAQKLNHQKVMDRLEHEKNAWFVKAGPEATIAFVQHFIYPRVVTSYADTLFCCKFVRLLIKLKTPGFQLLDFFNSWTIMLTQCIRSCSEREARIFGVFLREAMSYMLMLRKDEKVYNAEMKDNPCFHRNYYMRVGADAGVEWTKFTDIQRGHAKWEGRIYKGLRQGLDSEDWMEKRNALLLLCQSYESFPVVEKYAKLILTEVEKIAEKDGVWSDVKTLALSLARQLKSRQEYWVDKVAEKTSTTTENAGAKTAGKTKNSLGISAPPAKNEDSKAPVDAAKSDRERDRQSTKRQTPEETAPAEKRSRREEEVRAGKEDAKFTTTDRDDKEQREKRDSRESKDAAHHPAKDQKETKAKSHDRPDAKASKDKESRDPKDVRDHNKDSKAHTSAERPRDKDRDREKAATKTSGEKDKGMSTSSTPKDAREGDRSKRSSGSNSVPEPSPATSGRPAQSPAHDERGEKRRRTDRDGDAGQRRSERDSDIARNSDGDRGSGDRYGGGGGGYSSHQPRNALTAGPDPTNSGSHHHSGSRQAQNHDYSRRGGGSGNSYQHTAGGSSGGSSRHEGNRSSRR